MLFVVPGDLEAEPLRLFSLPKAQGFEHPLLEVLAQDELSLLRGLGSLGLGLAFSFALPARARAAPAAGSLGAPPLSPAGAALAGARRASTAVVVVVAFFVGILGDGTAARAAVDEVLFVALVATIGARHYFLEIEVHAAWSPGEIA